MPASRILRSSLFALRSSIFQPQAREKERRKRKEKQKPPRPSPLSPIARTSEHIPARKRHRIIDTPGIDPANDTLNLKLIARRLGSRGGVEILAAGFAGLIEADGVGPFALIDPEVLVGALEAALLKGGQGLCVGVDVHVVLFAVQLPAEDEVLVAALGEEGPEGGAFVDEGDAVVGFEVAPGWWGAVWVSGEGVDGGCYCAERAQDDDC